MEYGMTKNDFCRLIDLAVEKASIKYESHVYVALTWWNDAFMPLTMLDGNCAAEEKCLVFGDTPCRTWTNGLPCGFWVDDDTIYAENVVRRPLTLQRLRSGIANGCNTVGFLLCSSPRNMWIEINPFKTKVITNGNREVVFCLYADDRDGGEKVPFERMTADSIDVIDGFNERGTYRYGAWTKTCDIRTACADECGGCREPAVEEGGDASDRSTFSIKAS